MKVLKASLLILLSNIPNVYGLELGNDIYSDYDKEIKITLNDNDEAISCIKGFVDKLRNKIVDVTSVRDGEGCRPNTKRRLEVQSTDANTNLRLNNKH